jgi:hypothetical protein
MVKEMHKILAKQKPGIFSIIPPTGIFVILVFLYLGCVVLPKAARNLAVIGL